MSIDLDPLEVEGLVPPSEERTRRPRRASTIDLEPMAIEGVAEPAEPAHEVAENKNKAVNPAPGAADRIMQWLDSGNGTYMGGFSPEAAASGIADVLTFDHADELSGLLQSGVFEGRGFDEGEYTERRDRYRRRRGRDQEGHEGSVAVGALGGVAATLPAFAATLPAKAPGIASALGRIGTAAAEGLGIGSLSGFGRSEAEGADLAKDTVRGGLEGAAFSGIVGGGVEALRGLGGRVADFARSGARQRLRQAGAERTPELRRIEARGHGDINARPEEIAGELRDAGVFGRMGLASTDAVQGNIGAMGNVANGTLASTRAALAGQPVDVRPLLNHLEQQRRRLGTGGESRQLRDAIRQMEMEYADLLETGISVEELGRRRANVGSRIKVEQQQPTGMEQAHRALYGGLAEAEASAVERSGIMPRADWDLARRRAELGLAYDAVATSAEQRRESRSAIGITDAIMASGGGGIGMMADLAGGGGLGTALGFGASRLAQSPRARALANETMAAIGRRAPSEASQPTLDALRRAGTIGAVRGMAPDTGEVDVAEAGAPDPFAEDTSPLMLDAATPDADLDGFLSATDDELDSFLGDI